MHWIKTVKQSRSRIVMITEVAIVMDLIFAVKRQAFILTSAIVYMPKVKDASNRNAF